MVQQLRLCAPNAGDPGSIPGQGTRSHMPQLRVHKQQLKIPCAATNKDQRSCILQQRPGTAKKSKKSTPLKNKQTKNQDIISRRKNYISPFSPEILSKIW